MVRVIRATFLLAICAVSLVLAGWELWDGRATGFAFDNALQFASRRVLLQNLIFAAALVATCVASYVAAVGPRAGNGLLRFARICSPLAMAAFLPPLVDREARDPLVTVIAIAAFLFVLERLLRSSASAAAEYTDSIGVPENRPTRAQKLLCLGVVIGGAIFYAAYMSRYTIYSHRRFGTYNFDLGQYDNIFWSVLHGYGLRCSPLGNFAPWSELGNHAELSVFLLVPFYAIRPNAETLLIIQACLLALGAVPLYLFAARRLVPVHAAVLAFCYLLYPPLHGSNFYDFHFQPIAATFVLFTIYFVETRRWIPAALAYAMAIGCREDVCIGLAILGLYLVLTGYRPRAGAIMSVVGVSYFVVMRFFIMAQYGPGWFSDIYKELYPGPDGPHSYGGVMVTLMTNPSYVFHTLLTPDKLRYVLQILTPLAFLPLRRPYLLPSLIQGSLFTLLTTAYPPTTDIGFQYSGHFTPYVFAASALALAAYRKGQSRPALVSSIGALAAGTLLCTIHWGAFPPRGLVKGGFVVLGFDPPTPAMEQKERDLQELNRMVPPDARIAVSEEELPHVSGRLNVLTLKYAIGNAEYVLYGTSSMGSTVGEQALASGSFQEIARRPGLVLLKRK